MNNRDVKQLTDTITTSAKIEALKALILELYPDKKERFIELFRSCMEAEIEEYAQVIPESISKGFFQLLQESIPDSKV